MVDEQNQPTEESPTSLPFPQGEREEEDGELSRRKFLTGALAGGAAGLVAAAGTGAVVWKVVDDQADRAKASADDEIARLQGLVNLYEKLERVGLDAIIQTGMAAVGLLFGGLEVGVNGLKSGLELVEKGLLSLEKTFPIVQTGIEWVEKGVSALADGIDALQATLGRVVDKTSPITEALGDFVSFVLDKLPFGIGDKVQIVLNALSDLVSGIPELIEGINSHLLEPLRQEWFSTEEGKGLDDVLLKPLVGYVFDPLEALLGDLAGLIDEWQQKLVAPSQRAIEERAAIREQIAQYKKEHGLA
ncbi:MAG: hypothetical protein JXM73_03860 [Anaerolineae bacterium]|nr:hypothetical protein [Anaerolineae bacterium]